MILYQEPKPYLHSTIFRFVRLRDNGFVKPFNNLHSTIFRFVQCLYAKWICKIAIYIPLFLDLYDGRRRYTSQNIHIYIPLFLDLYLKVRNSIFLYFLIYIPLFLDLYKSDRLVTCLCYRYLHSTIFRFVLLFWLWEDPSEYRFTFHYF